MCGDVSVKIAFALTELTGDCRRYLDSWMGGYDEDFPVVQIVKDNQTLAQSCREEFLVYDSVSQLAEPFYNLQGAILKCPASMLSHSVLLHVPGHTEILLALFLLLDYRLLSNLQP